MKGGLILNHGTTFGREGMGWQGREQPKFGGVGDTGMQDIGRQRHQKKT